MKTIDQSTRYFYRKLRAHPTSMRVGFAASTALADACTLARFDELRLDGLVRITSEDEQESYFSVYGREDNPKYQKQLEDTLRRWGCVAVISEYKDAAGGWQMADSIGMCVYANPESPFENCYVPQLMAEAIKQAEAVLAKAELNAVLAD